MESGTPPGRKLMVVAEPTRESATALQYALSHAVLEQDELILIHVVNPSSWKNTFSFLRRSLSLTSRSSASSFEGGGVGEVDFLEEMKRVCEIAQPKIRVHIERVQMEARDKATVIQMEARDKATVILLKSKVLGVDLLIIGQPRSLSTAILGCRRPEGSIMGIVDTAEYLIEKCKCTCVGVQKKGQNAGYLLNTKTYRNFWLLA